MCQSLFTLHLFFPLQVDRQAYIFESCLDIALPSLAQHLRSLRIEPHLYIVEWYCRQPFLRPRLTFSSILLLFI